MKSEELMANYKNGSSWRSGLRKPMLPTLSDMIQSRRAEGRPYVAGELRADLIRREMARHNFTEEQALAEILAFSK
jgi:hypothetical protein